MATLIDLGLLQAFDFIFPVILVWAFMFAILRKTKVLGDNLNADVMVASAAALMVLLSRTIIDMINFMIPWFSVAIIFFVLMLLMFMLFGAKDTEKFYTDKGLRWVLIAVGLLIVAAAGGKVMGQTLLEQSATAGTAVDVGNGTSTSSDFEQNIYATLFNPKVLGLLVIFTIVVFAVALLSGAPET
ncbi:MAG: hypothetical protein KKA62_03180 [Nanoarchaeota archaeon]|nr:hypothetical protein [Nanoarchaeota archaeon]MBU1643733.1 hypothetical protein [Nanoarchaeota archaeon]MBU1976929.1 hypothetical protein [Nanoarchaeota archaeon]